MPQISPQTIQRLAETENLVGMKDSGDIIHIQDVVFGTREKNFRVLVGFEYHVVAGLVVGAGVLLGWTVGFAACLIGLGAAYTFDLPYSPTLILSLGGAFLCAMVIRAVLPERARH